MGWGMKVCSRRLGQMVKMAAKPINGKTPSKIFFRTSRPIWCVVSGTPEHRCLSGLTLIYFTARSNFVIKAFYRKR